MQNQAQVPVVALLSAPVPLSGTREQVMSAFESTTAYNAAMKDILQKYYTYDEISRTLGSIYLWRSREAAEAFFQPGWSERFASKWGTTPHLQYMEALIVLRPLSLDVSIEAM